MLVPPSPIPQNSLLPVPKSQVEWDNYTKARVIAAGVVGQVSYECSSPTPDSFSDLGPSIVREVGTQIQAAQQNLLTRTNALVPATVQAGAAGAVISDQQISDAPTVLPMNVVPSMLPPNENTIAARQARQHARKVPGTPWGVAPGQSPACSGTFLERVRANPWGAAFLVAGLGVVVYAATKE